MEQRARPSRRSTARAPIEAVIIAAGRGSRLDGLFSPKPLARVGGAALIEIAIAQARAAGADRIRVVTGYRAAEIEAELERIAARQGVEVTPVRLADWSLPNGYSVIAGARGIGGPFLLLMADHLFGDGLLERLVAQPLDDADALLAVDRDCHAERIDPEDATHVLLDERSQIRAIGKRIARFNAVDCGAFLATGALTEAIEEAILEGKPGSLSDGMQWLADRGRARGCDVTGCWWIDVDNPADHALACDQAPTHIATLAKAREQRIDHG